MGKIKKMIQIGAIRYGLSIGCLFLVFAGSVFAGSWRGLVPLKSTKAEVNALLMEPVFESDSVSNYETDSSKISITYSAGNCSEESKYAWDVPKDVIIVITVFPRNEVTYEDLKFDLSKFEKFPASRDLPGMFRYWNADDGISFVGDEHTSSGRNLIVSQSYKQVAPMGLVGISVLGCYKQDAPTEQRGVCDAVFVRRFECSRV